MSLLCDTVKCEQLRGKVLSKIKAKEMNKGNIILFLVMYEQKKYNTVSSNVSYTL